jgi:hypothetical protein
VVGCGAVASGYRVVSISNPHLPGLILEEEAVRRKIQAEIWAKKKK